MAQLVEQRIRNAWVLSSSLSIGSCGKPLTFIRSRACLFLSAVGKDDFLTVYQVR